MKKILILGAGAMGSAFTVPCVENNHDVDNICDMPNFKALKPNTVFK